MLAQPSPSSEITPMLAHHERESALTLASAFLEDPILGQYLFRQDSYKASGAAAFFCNMLATQCTGGSSLRYVAVSQQRSHVEGVALWQPPGGKQGLSFTDMMGMVSVAPSAFGFSRIWRSLRTGMRVDEHHPTHKHYYLAFLGVHPTQQGRGLGRRLLTPVLERADKEGVPCYLENSNKDNLAFYESLGFKVLKEIQVGAKTPVYAMQREPVVQKGGE